MELIKLSKEQINELSEQGVGVVGDMKKFRVIHDGTEYRFLPHELEQAKAKFIELTTVFEEVEEVEDIEEVEEEKEKEKKKRKPKKGDK